MSNDRKFKKEKYYFIPYYNGSGFWGVLFYIILGKFFKSLPWKSILKTIAVVVVILNILIPISIVGWVGVSALHSLEKSDITFNEIIDNQIDKRKLERFEIIFNERLNSIWGKTKTFTPPSLNETDFSNMNNN